MRLFDYVTEPTPRPLLQGFDDAGILPKDYEDAVQINHLGGVCIGYNGDRRLVHDYDLLVADILGDKKDMETARDAIDFIAMGSYLGTNEHHSIITHTI